MPRQWRQREPQHAPLVAGFGVVLVLAVAICRQVEAVDDGSGYPVYTVPCTATVGDWQYNLRSLTNTDNSLQCGSGAAEEDEKGEMGEMDTQLQYLATVCDSYIIDDDCGVDDAVAMVQGSCSVLGVYADESAWSFLEADDPKRGVKVTYGQGSSCGAGLTLTMSTTFRFWCDKSGPTAEDQSRMCRNVTESQADCTSTVDFYAKDVCPIYVGSSGGAAGVSTGAWVAMIMIILVAGSCIGASLYKRRKYGASGVESIPGISLCRECWALGQSVSYSVVGQKESETPEHAQYLHTPLAPDMEINEFAGNDAADGMSGDTQYGDEVSISFST